MYWLFWSDHVTSFSRAFISTPKSSRHFYVIGILNIEDLPLRFFDKYWKRNPHTVQTNSRYPRKLECASPSFKIDVWHSCIVYPLMFLPIKSLRGDDAKIIIPSLTKRSFGVHLASGSFNRQHSTNASAILGNLPSPQGPLFNLGAGSFTICCSSSKMLIVIPLPCKLTPLLFLLSFFFLLSLSSFRACRFNSSWEFLSLVPFIPS